MSNQSPVASSASMSTPSPSLDAPTSDNCFFFLCDVQETFRGRIMGYEGVIAASKFLLQAAQTLGVPVVATEQRPFKPTVAELAPLIAPESNPHARTFSKSLFSMLTPEVASTLASQGARRHIVLFGIEAHVCVLQTTLDLLRGGYVVHLPLEAIGSQNECDRAAALERFRAEAARVQPSGGAIVFTSAESVVFEMFKDATHPQFKTLMPATKEFGAAKKGGIAPSATQASKL